jgi:hypothetical protein
MLDVTRVEDMMIYCFDRNSLGPVYIPRLNCNAGTQIALRQNPRLIDNGARLNPTFRGLSRMHFSIVETIQKTVDFQYKIYFHLSIILKKDALSQSPCSICFRHTTSTKYTNGDSCFFHSYISKIITLLSYFYSSPVL